MRNLLLKVEVLAAVSAIAVLSLYLLFPGGSEPVQQESTAYPNQPEWRIRQLEQRVRELSTSLDESEQRVEQWEDSWPEGEAPEYYRSRHGVPESITKPGIDGSGSPGVKGRTTARKGSGSTVKEKKAGATGSKSVKKNTAYQKKKQDIDGSLGTSGTGSRMVAGLLGLYYQGRKFEELKLVMTDYEIDFDFADRSPDRIILEDNFSIRWEGAVKIENEADYTFHTLSDDGVKLRVAGRLVINNWGDHASTLNSGKIHLKKGIYPIRLDFYERGGSAVIKLYWSSNKFSMEIIPSANLLHNPDAAEAARKKVR